MFYKKCGLQLSDNVKFCTKCGAKAERGNDAAENTEILHTEVQHDATEMLSHDISADARSMPKKKNKIWLIILLCEMSIVLLGAIGFGVYFNTDSFQIDSILKCSDDSIYINVISGYTWPEGNKNGGDNVCYVIHLSHDEGSVKLDDSYSDVIEKGYRKTQYTGGKPYYPE